jgi:hypothetical protein
MLAIFFLGYAWGFLPILPGLQYDQIVTAPRLLDEARATVRQESHIIQEALRGGMRTKQICITLFAAVLFATTIRESREAET